jgi:hypothetical protein
MRMSVRRLIAALGKVPILVVVRLAPWQSEAQYHC